MERDLVAITCFAAALMTLAAALAAMMRWRGATDGAPAGRTRGRRAREDGHREDGPPVLVKRLAWAEGLELPHYAGPGEAGADVAAAVEDPVTLAPGERRAIPTGLCFEVPTGWEMQIRPRSGNAIKLGLGMVNSLGTLDSSYRGEAFVLAINHGDAPITIVRGMRIGQLVVKRAPQARFIEVATLGASPRGEGGLGSTGTEGVGRHAGPTA